MQKKTSKLEMKVTICLSAVSSGCKKLAILTSLPWIKPVVDISVPAETLPSTWKMEIRDSPQDATKNAEHSLAIFILQNHMLHTVFPTLDAGLI